MSEEDSTFRRWIYAFFIGVPALCFAAGFLVGRFTT